MDLFERRRCHISQPHPIPDLPGFRARVRVSGYAGTIGVEDIVLMEMLK
jgi:hypothetical protein